MASETEQDPPKTKRGNQWKPTREIDLHDPLFMSHIEPAPLTTALKEAIMVQWKMRKTDKDIVKHLLEKHIDTSIYGLSVSTFKTWRKSLKLERTRKQAHTPETIRNAMLGLRKRYPNAGTRDVKSILFHREQMLVSRKIVVAYFRKYEPELIRQRKANRLKRKRFWAAGVNDIWAMDQHDKWKPKFGLALHVGIDPVAGKILWLKVWWTNSNPRLILGFYLDTVESLGFMPMITQSDPGSENYGVANGHTFLRQWHDPWLALVKMLQHRWKREKKNVMPEITWSQLRRRWSAGFEDVLDSGLVEEWYDKDNPIQAMLFRWLFIPWIQKELDHWRDMINNTTKRADKNKILPHGAPNDIAANPERYGVLDFGIKVQPDAIADARKLYAPPEHEVFELVPAQFANMVNQVYVSMNSPSLDIENIWTVYLTIRDHLVAVLNALPQQLNESWRCILTEIDLRDAQDAAMFAEMQEEFQALKEGQELEGGLRYMGGVNHGVGPDDSDNEDDGDLVLLNAGFALDPEAAAEGLPVYDSASDAEVEEEGAVATYLTGPRSSP